MANPQTADFLRFRRTFTLLIVLVVLPSAGLSGFGVVAIVNERAAVEKRLEASWAGRLQSAWSEVDARLKTLSVGSEAPLRVDSRGVQLLGATFDVSDDRVSSQDPKLEPVVKSLAPQFVAVPAEPIVFSASTPQGVFALVALRRDGTVRGGFVSPDALAEVVREVSAPLLAGGEPAQLSMVPVKQVPAEGVLARLASGVSEAREAALGPPELASLSLPAPMQDFRLVAQALGEDPVGKASARNRTVYVVLLTLFYVTLALGVVYTGRSLYREARLSRLKTDFVSLVSHELRTPLTSIRMFIDMLAMGRVKDPAEMQTVLDLLSRETSRLSTMIETVLDFSRLESGKKQYDKQPVPVQAVVDAAVAAFRAQRVGATMTFTVEAEPNLPTLRLDKDALAGAVLNLLQNAFKYTEADKRITLRAKQAGPEVVLEVEDNGVGVPRREQRRIFDRFYRVDSLLTRQTEGTGLGLSIAQRIVEAHGGRISLDSAPGKGSTFRVHLPLAG
ncbi:MAG: two-component sensor histidine kinase [Myxococcaceae bacterium]|nr:two-component sensor histidine kinase [Myxococcaceae bacterium]MCA3016019.1 two-component sensor histidine kinase [Myxococcaceae bacterium]